MQLQQTPFPGRREEVFLQLKVLLEPQVTRRDFRKYRTLTAEVPVRGLHGGKARVRCENADRGHCALHRKGGIKALKVRTEDEI